MEKGKNMKEFMLVSDQCYSIAWGEVAGGFMVEHNEASDPLMGVFATLDEAFAWCKRHSYFALTWRVEPNPY